MPRPPDELLSALVHVLSEGTWDQIRLQRLAQFLEFLVHPTVRQGAEQQQWVAELNVAPQPLPQ